MSKSRKDEKDDEELLVREAQAEAIAYISSFAWCPEIQSISYEDGVPGIVAVFIVSFQTPIEGTSDDRLWIVIGDLPSAYLVMDAGGCVRETLYSYCDLMTDWVTAVRTHSSLDDVFPVRADPTEEFAAMLDHRVKYLRQHIIETLI